MDPEWCQIRYSYESQSDLSSLISFDQEERSFEFFEVADLSVAGGSFTEYTITVKAESGNAQTLQTTET